MIDVLTHQLNKITHKWYCVACTPVREADRVSKRTAVVLSRKHALELELKWVCTYVCVRACVLHPCV